MKFLIAIALLFITSIVSAASDFADLDTMEDPAQFLLQLEGMLDSNEIIACNHADIKRKPDGLIFKKLKNKRFFNKLQRISISYMFVVNEP